MFCDQVSAKGRLHARLIGPYGELKAEQKFSNLLVTLGRNYIASRMAANDTSVISHMGVGTSSTATALGDVALGAQLARVPLTAFQASTNVVRAEATFAPGTGTGPIQEVGLFNAAEGDKLTNRALFDGVVTKGFRDTLVVVWEIEIR